jgi:signal transduction histidine kinase
MALLATDRAVRRTVVVAVLGGLVTLLVLVVPWLRFAYRSSAGTLVLETAVTLVAGLVALLLYGRYRRSRRLGELLLVYSMTLLASSALFFVTVPGLLTDQAADTASNWAALVVRVVGAVLLVVAALVRPDRVHRVFRPAAEVAGVVLILLVVAVMTYVLSAQLPDAVAVQAGAQESRQPVLRGHPVVLALQSVNLVCYAIAAVVFTRRAALENDDLLGWLGAGAALGAWARVAYLLFPSLYTEWLYVGDLLRLGMYVLLLVGAVREINHYWEAQAAVAVEGERRRLARDLHDGVVQELGYIRSESQRPLPGDAMARIGAAADRALDEARRAVNALASMPDEALAAALGRAASEVGDRYDVAVELDLDDQIVVPPQRREALVRIAREAVSNAARHAQTTSVSVRLQDGCLVVEDEGRGFDVSRGRAGGFGLTSMRERAAAIGAAVSVTSVPGQGTRVEVTW